ncbi:arginosuccinate synthase [Methanocalculus chunghsingensis]|uniref:Arginosuccinate synthase n=1 Tax=Methanocalculus chunghsingensis TaxID=156457 RepID=A0A8J7W930_9EURY|nr:alpha hydrolase [Methanocalculus chunghsingensis]MBR1368642.1 arginosuccinate synthase [Methanocalculus chunghsingensis]
MKVGMLYSGGKDSSLAAILLSRDYSVELATFVFDPMREVSQVAAAAEALGLPWRKMTFAPGFIDEIIGILNRCGYPNEAINEIHRRSLCVLAQEYEVVADGTRFLDRVPMLTPAEVQSFEDRTGVSYIRPLLGFGRREIERLVNRMFAVVYGETSQIQNGDYEREIRDEMTLRGIDWSGIFPKNHQQSLVTGRIELTDQVGEYQ